MSITAIGRELNVIKDALEGLAGAVVAQLRALAVAYSAGDQTALARIVSQDSDIDAREQHVDDLCRAFMQLRSPIGPDFRIVMGIFDIARGLERIGDCVEYVARHGATQIAAQSTGQGPELIREMIAACLALLEATHECWQAGDAKRARTVAGLDDGVDRLQRLAHASVVTEVRAGGLDVADGLETVLIANKLESLGDVACHLAEAVVLMIDAADIRHGQDRAVTLKAL